MYELSMYFIVSGVYGIFSITFSVPVFDGISTFVCYSMLKLLILEEQ